MFHLRNIADWLLYVMVSRYQFVWIVSSMQMVKLWKLYWHILSWVRTELSAFFSNAYFCFRNFRNNFLQVEKAIQKKFAHRKLHKYLPIHFEKFLKTPLLEKTSRQLLLKPLHTEIFYFMFFRIAQEHSHEKLHILLKSMYICKSLVKHYIKFRITK